MLQRDKRRAREVYRKQRKIEHKIHRKKKKKHINDKVQSIEIANGENETRRFYQTANSIRKGYGVRQGDGLSAVLFNLALHNAISHVDPGGSIFYKSAQLCGYADDIAIIARNLRAMENIYSRLENLEVQMGLNGGTSKTIYMAVSADPTRRNVEDMSLNGTPFEGVQKFKYGTTITGDNAVSNVIQQRLAAGNSAYFSCLSRIYSPGNQN
uniref:Reverse transcriptase domain-containing protein n=1 Tax=Lygus hesperus TaxID=30085 RepID=A0A0A9XJD0_LYGHE